MKLTILILICLIHDFSTAQDYPSLIQYYTELLEARTEEYKTSHPKYLNLIPNLGTRAIIQDDAVHIVPTMSWSISKFIQDRKERARNKGKMKSIERITTLEYESDLRKIKAERNRLKSYQNELEIKLQLLEIKEKIYRYDSVKYSRNEINPDTFYKSKIQIITERYQIELVQQKITQSEDKIYQLLKL